PLAPPPPSSTLFPYTTLFRSERGRHLGAGPVGRAVPQAVVRLRAEVGEEHGLEEVDLGPRRRDGQRRDAGGLERVEVRHPGVEVDRKSTRLNSSHVKISYAVF